MFTRLNNIILFIIKIFSPISEKYLKEIKGVIHVGANTGREKKLYSKYNLNVLWIEPIPEIYKTLCHQISKYPSQKALNALITDVDEKEYIFHIANNNGESSSIFELALHKEIWPHIEFKKNIKLISKTLPTLINENKIKTSDYDMLVLDTQGAELLILKGAIDILNIFKYIKVEVPDFESYKGSSQLKDINNFFNELNIKEFSRNKFASHPKGGNYYDIVYHNTFYK